MPARRSRCSFVRARVFLFDRSSVAVGRDQCCVQRGAQIHGGGRAGLGCALELVRWVWLRKSSAVMYFTARISATFYAAVVYNS